MPLNASFERSGFAASDKFDRALKMILPQDRDASEYLHVSCVTVRECVSSAGTRYWALSGFDASDKLLDELVCFSEAGTKRLIEGLTDDLCEQALMFLRYG